MTTSSTPIRPATILTSPQPEETTMYVATEPTTSAATTVTGSNSYEQLFRRDSSGAPAANDATAAGIHPNGGLTSAANVLDGLVQSHAKPIAENDAQMLDIDPVDQLDPGNVEAVAALRGAANIRLRPIVGTRLLSARDRSGLGQVEAAHLLGYATSSQLNQWEAGRRLPPLSELIKAARLYVVSVDYLVGDSDDQVRDHAQALRDTCLRGVRRQIERVAEITVDQIARHTRLVGPHIGTVRGLLKSGDGLLDSIQTFCRLNLQAMEQQRGGATLLRCAEEFERELLDARKSIRLHDALDGDLRRALAAISSEDQLPGNPG